MDTEDRLALSIELTAEEFEEYARNLTPNKLTYLFNAANNRFQHYTFILNDISILYSRFDHTIVPFRNYFIYNNEMYDALYNEDLLKRAYLFCISFLKKLNKIIEEMEKIIDARSMAASTIAL